MSNGDDIDILVPALQTVIAAWEKGKEGKSLLGQDPPDQEVLAPIEKAIENCAAYNAIQGKALFSGYSGVVLHAPSLALPLLYRADRPDRGDKAISEAAEWLVRVLTTKQATGIFTAVVWGLKIDKPLEIDPETTLLPFDQLPDSYMKRRVCERAHEAWDKSVWVTERYYDVPATAIRRKLTDFPYIGPPNCPFDRLEGVQYETRDQLTFLQVTATGAPIVAGSWFEWEDDALDINSFENFVVWHVPEIEPRVAAHISAKVEDIDQWRRSFLKLPEEWRQKVLRSMERFVLSQCRNQVADRFLELAIAFETVVSGKDDGASVRWKVGVRSAQLIGGALEKRQEIRNDLNFLYDRRNATAHGRILKQGEIDKNLNTLEKCWSIYRDLITGFLELAVEPDWKALELEPRTRT